MGSLNKTILEVQSILRDSILFAFETFDIPNKGIDVFESNQVHPTAKRDYVTFHLDKTIRVGWPHIFYDVIDGHFSRIESFAEQQDWEIRIVRRRPVNVTEEWLSADDIANMLKTWWNGIGNDYFRQHGVSNLIAKDSSVDRKKDDSDLNLKSSGLIITLVVPKSVITRHNMIDSVVPDVLPI